MAMACWCAAALETLSDWPQLRTVLTAEAIRSVDGSRVRDPTAVRNFALLRKIAINLMSQDPPLKPASVVNAKSGLG